MSGEDFERVPCDDGMCTGIVGLDGRCGTCGLAGERAPTAAPASHDAPEAHAPPEADAPDALPEAAPEARDDDARVPCGDDMCTGIVGLNGRCGTCGRAG